MKFAFKPLSLADLPLIHAWLERPHVKAFWDQDVQWNEELILEKYGPYVNEYKVVDGKKQPMYAYIIIMDGNPIGYIQLYDAFIFPRDTFDLKEALKDTPYAQSNLAAIDIFIGEESAVGKGIGPAAMKQFLRDYAWGTFDGCFVDPDKINPNAIRAYEKAGFVKIKDAPDHKAIIMIAGAT